MFTDLRKIFLWGDNNKTTLMAFCLLAFNCFYPFISNAEEDADLESEIRSLKMDYSLLQEYHKSLEAEYLQDKEQGVLTYDEERQFKQNLKEAKQKTRIIEGKLRKDHSLLAKKEAKMLRQHARVEDVEKQKMIVKKGRLQEKQRKELLNQATRLYQNSVAASKALLISHAKDQVAELKTLLGSEDFPQNYKESFEKKLALAERRIFIKEQKVATQEARARKRQGIKEEKIKQKEELANQKRQKKEDKRNKSKIFREEKAAAKKDVDHQKQLEQQTEESRQRLEEKKRIEEDLAFQSLLRKRNKMLTEKKDKLSREQKRVRIHQKKVDEDIQRQKARSSSEQKELENTVTSQVDPIYRQGIKSYKEGAYDLAKQLFNDVDDIYPNYKLTRNYLTVINDFQEDIRKERAKIEDFNVDNTLRGDIVSDALDIFDNRK